jgi:hypothetical protein
MFRGSILSVVTVVLATGLALADPGIQTSIEAGFLRVQLEGTYAGSTYSVWRANQSESGYQPVTNGDVLCTGECFATDAFAEPGQTYYYRFDVIFGQGGFASFGPYTVTVPAMPLAARVWPNPGAGAARIELSLPGGRRDLPVEAEARILDLAGRTVQVLHRGALARGVTTLEWNGRDASGRTIPAGLYFLHFSSPLGSTTTRVLRIR